MKRESAGRLTEADAQRRANRIARKFGVFECDRCAREIAKALGRGFDATFERLRTADRSDVIGLVSPGIQVSTNSVHVGVRIGELIFDNLHQDGVAATEWAGRFVTATDAALVGQSKPIRDFFGKVFLTRQFSRWLYAHD